MGEDVDKYSTCKQCIQILPQALDRSPGVDMSILVTILVRSKSHKEGNQLRMGHSINKSSSPVVFSTLVEEILVLNEMFEAHIFEWYN